MKTKSHSFIKSISLALCVGVTPVALLAQSDNFNSGTDTAWSRQDPIHQYDSLPAQVTFSFPVLGPGNDGYRLQTAVSPAPSTLGQSRGGSLRKDVSYNTNFYAAIDLVNWQNANTQAVGLVARIKTPGLGTSSGYYLAYNNATPTVGQGSVGIYRLLNEAYTTLSTSPIYLYNTNTYRFAFFGQGTNLEGRVYLLPFTNTSIASVSAVDANYATGYCGLAQSDQSSSKTGTTDATYDNYLATNFFLADQPQNVIYAVGGNFSLTTKAIGTPPLSYQWLRNGTNLTEGGNISGSTSAALTLANITLADTASYQVIVTDASARSATSAVATATVLNFPHGSPDASFSFDDGNVPAGTSEYGNAYVAYDGLAGALHLTDAFNGEQGSFIVDDLNAGATVSNFDVQFDALIGGNTTTTSADGMSFVWANDLLSQSFGESGAGSGLTVIFEIYNANASIPGPGILVKYGGTYVAQTLLPLSFMQTGTNFVPVNIRLEPGGLLSVIYNSQVIYNNLLVPGLADGMAGGRFGWGARTGLYNENHWLDNIRITTSPQILSLVTNGTDIVITYSGVLQSAANVDGTYADVAGATSPYTFSPPAGASQQFWRSRSP